MPELPEVETARSFCEKIIGKQACIQVWTKADTIIYCNASHLSIRQALTGKRVTAIRRKGKHLWMELEGGPHIAFHLGMTGSFSARKDKAPQPRFTKLDMQLESGDWLSFINIRRLGRIRLLQNAEIEAPISSLGWDPMSERPTPAHFCQAIQTRKTPIKTLILNQAFIAGIGILCR